MVFFCFCRSFFSNFNLINKRDINLFQLLRGNNAMKMQIVKKLSSAMGIRRPAEKIQSIHPALGASVMITSVKNGNMTVTMTPSVRDLWNVATTTALLNSICLKPMIAVTCQVCMIMHRPLTGRRRRRDTVLGKELFLFWWYFSVSDL